MSEQSGEAEFQAELDKLEAVLTKQAASTEALMSAFEAQVADNARLTSQVKELREVLAPYANLTSLPEDRNRARSVLAATETKS